MLPTFIDFLNAIADDVRWGSERVHARAQGVKGRRRRQLPQASLTLEWTRRRVATNVARRESPSYSYAPVAVAFMPLFKALPGPRFSAAAAAGNCNRNGNSNWILKTSSSRTTGIVHHGVGRNSPLARRARPDPSVRFSF